MYENLDDVRAAVKDAAENGVVFISDEDLAAMEEMWAAVDEDAEQEWAAWLAEAYEEEPHVDCRWA